jgi:glyoxylase-like metal-dependent hydrolase (beta-lactamase superfamily II)
MRTFILLALSACSTTSHPVVAGDLGKPTGSAAMEASLATPGPVTIETVNTADWEVPLSGLLDVDKAGLADRSEPIQVFVHVLRHPTRGTFIVDTGVERDLRSVPSLIKRAMHTEKMTVHEDTAALKERLGRVDGVLLTHIHLDHVLGMQDLPASTPVYSGPGDAGARSFQNLFLRPMFDAFFAGHAPVRELAFAPDADGRFAGVLDLFGDGSVWAIHAPGHTPGTVAYLVRTPSGPVLLTGDVCHTRYGWEHEIAPGSYTADHPSNERSLHALRELVARHPHIEVRLGHQR